MLTPCVEPVGGEEHGEEEHYPRVRAERVPQAVEFGLPGGMAGRDDASAVGADHLGGVSHEQGNHDADTGEDEETNLQRR